jgi:hypothetical protein
MSGSEPESIGIYLDCEFTDLTNDADLLSIGFAAESGETLYIEITDWDVAHCVPSEFVVEVVLPLFGRHDPERLTRDEAAARIDEWIAELRQRHGDRIVFMMSDSALDWQFLIELWVPMPGRETWASKNRIKGMLIQMMTQSWEAALVFDLVEKYHELHQERHHALVDAMALRWAMVEIMQIRP